MRLYSTDLRLKGPASKGLAGEAVAADWNQLRELHVNFYPRGYNSPHSLMRLFNTDVRWRNPVGKGFAGVTVPVDWSQLREVQVNHYLLQELISPHSLVRI